MQTQEINTEILLKVQQLACIRNEIELFSNLDFTMQAGDIIQIKGLNGSGKTSLIRILAGLAQADDGSLYWRSVLIDRAQSDYFSDMAYIGHLPGVKKEFTVLENLKMFHSLGAVKSQCDYEAAIEQVGLALYRDTQVRKLSAGQRRRVALARLILHRKSIWILDEPQASLDVYGLKILEDMIASHIESGGMLVITTHQPINLPEANIKTIELSQAG